MVRMVPYTLVYSWFIHMRQNRSLILWYVLLLGYQNTTTTTKIQYSETDTHEKAPFPGPSRTHAGKIPTTPTKSKQKESNLRKKTISPIKFPEATPKKNSEDLPLSKLTTPKRHRSDARQDLRKRLDMVPIFTEPKLHSNRGPLETRINRDLLGPWLPGTGPKCGTAHRNRPFIAGNSTWSSQEASGSNEEEEEKVSEDDVSTDSDGVNDPRKKQHK